MEKGEIYFSKKFYISFIYWIRNKQSKLNNNSNKNNNEEIFFLDLVGDL